MNNKDMYGSKSYIEHFMKVSGSLNIMSSESRKNKVDKILAVIRDYHNQDLNDLSCLDIGCSSILSDSFNNIVGIDTDKKAIEIAKKSKNKKNISFIIGDGMNIPFKDNSFDVVICNHIYEHVPDSKKLMDEIHRVLKKGGFCYFSAGNRFTFMEQHYKLPLLSWFPNWIGNYYLRLTGKGKFYEEKHFSYWKIRELIRKFGVFDYTPKLIKNPRKYFIKSKLLGHFPARVFPEWFIKLFYFFVPTYIFIVKK